MGLPDPQLDSIADQIAAGQEPSREQMATVQVAPASRRIADNLIVLAEISRFHRMVHGGAAPTMPAVVAPEPAAAVDCWGPLQLRGRLGRGGFGEVFRAWDPSLQREVALKLFRSDLDPGSRASQQLLQEARLLAGVRHENVVTVYGVESHGDRHGYWMELVHGRDLERILHDQGPMSAEEAAHVGMVLCKALAALHAVGLVHRDVKTTNVMRERGGRLVLMDFGSVTPAAPAGTAAATVVGTPVYMSPETLRGVAPAKGSDIYALGVLLYRLVTGAHPIEARSIDELRRAHDVGERRRLRDVRSDLPRSFCEVVDRALDPDPRGRFQTVGELEEALAGTPTSAVRAAAEAGPPAPTLRRSRARRGWLLLAAAVALLAAIGVGVWRPGGDPAAARIVVDARFYSLQHGRPVQLGDGATVAVGDPLWLNLQASRPVWVYVLNRDLNGEVNLLFPLAAHDLQNPLPATAPHELPGRAGGVRKGWRVSSPGGREEFMIVASPTRLAAFEESLAAIPQAGDPSGRMALALGGPQVAELVRGTAELVDLPEAGEQPRADADVFAAAERLGAAASDARGVWVRKIVLENPR